MGRIHEDIGSTGTNDVKLVRLVLGIVPLAGDLTGTGNLHKGPQVNKLRLKENMYIYISKHVKT